MKKIVLLTIVLSMLVCLFGCNASGTDTKNPNDNINSDEIQMDANPHTPTTDNMKVDISTEPPASIVGAIQSINFNTAEEMTEYLANGRYLSEKIVDGFGNRYEAFDSIAKSLYEGERTFYHPYVNGKLFSTIANILPGDHVPKFVFFGEEFNVNGEVIDDDVIKRLTNGYIKVSIEYLSDSKYFNTSNTYEALLSNLPQATPPDSKDEGGGKTFMLEYNGRSINSIFRKSVTESLLIPDIVMETYEFVIDDVYVRITSRNNPNFDIEEFLDGFELRPIELTTFSTAEKE